MKPYRYGLIEETYEQSSLSAEYPEDQDDSGANDANDGKNQANEGKNQAVLKAMAHFTTIAAADLQRATFARSELKAVLGVSRSREAQLNDGAAGIVVDVLVHHSDWTSRLDELNSLLSCTCHLLVRRWRKAFIVHVVRLM